MAGMEGLGRLFNVVPIAAGRGLFIGNVSGVTFVTTGNDTFTLTSATTFAGSYTSPGTITANVYKSSATNGSAVWVQDQTLISTNTIVSGAAIATAFTIRSTWSGVQGRLYLKLSVGGAGLVTAILHDLEYQRRATLLQIVSA